MSPTTVGVHRPGAVRVCVSTTVTDPSTAAILTSENVSVLVLSEPLLKLPLYPVIGVPTSRSSAATRYAEVWLPIDQYAGLLISGLIRIQFAGGVPDPDSCALKACGARFSGPAPKVPVGPTGPVVPVKPADPVGPVEPAPVAPVGPVKPIAPVGPVVPVPALPVAPVGPVNPIGPVGPVVPVPALPVGPVGPVGPVNPIEPVDPVVPMPAGPVGPIAPSCPS